jgi:CheY-like chemotaxis protein
MKESLKPDSLPRKVELASPPLERVMGSAADGKRRILIIDDDPNNTHVVKILLERSGPYLVMEENDAVEAHQTARRFRPDLILLDIMMPKEDGGDVAAQIQADRELHDTPIIFLTALVTKSEVESGLHIEGHPVVAKPINIPELIEAIEEHLRAPREL